MPITYKTWKKWLPYIIAGVICFIAEHALLSFINGDKFLSIGLPIYIVIGIGVGYILYRDKKKFQKLK